jgi:hypothetical protein
VNVTSQTLTKNRSRTKGCRLFRLLHPTYHQCTVYIWAKWKSFETATLPLVLTYQRAPNLKPHTKGKKPGVQVAHSLEILCGCG